MGNHKITSLIPEIKTGKPLTKKLIPVVVIGFDEVLGKKGRLYLRLLCRLVDKSISDYSMARNYLLEELKTNDRLAYRFFIIDHLEKCINAIHRAIKAFNSALKASGESKISSFVSQETIRSITEINVSDIRNRLEHIDEDILENKLEGGVFLDINENAEIVINKRTLGITQLVKILKVYYSFLSELFGNLPIKCVNGVYYYD